jgi:serine/threonine protein kinase
MSTPPPSPAPALVAEHDALPLGTRFGEFEILRVVGVGGFGIVYLAQDHSLERQVALKEYMPAALAARGNGSQITVRSAAFAETYAVGLRSFVNEARLLARFDHPSLVKVYRFWEDNGTAYMVMPFLRGMTLRDARRGMARAPDEAWIRSVIDPLLGALEALHREGVYHRDIAPDNVLLPPEGPPILLDFGAARHVISDRTQSLTAILKPSYAPIEQYAEMTALRQGPWTDIYALGAVMHFLVFGAPPPPATARAVQPDAEPIAQRVVPGVSARFLAIVDWTLGVRPLERPQNIAALRDALNGLTSIPDLARGAEVTAPGAHAPAGSAAKAPEAPTTFPPTQWVAPSQADATRLDPADEATRVPVPPASPVQAAVVAVPQPPVAAPPRVTEPPRVSEPPAAKPPRTAPQPAPEGKKGPMVAGLGLAGVVAAVVLWQFVGLLGPRGPAVAQADAASAAPAAASVPVVIPAVTQTAAPSTVVAPAAASTTGGEPSPAAAPTPITASTTPAATASAATRPLPGDARPVPLIVPGASAALAAASAPARPRPGRTVPTRDEVEAAATPYAAPNSVDDDTRRRAAQSARDATGGTRPVPTFTPSGPRSATEVCGHRVFLALAICMDRECERPIFRDQPDCKKVLEVKQRREQQ